MTAYELGEGTSTPREFQGSQFRVSSFCSSGGCVEVAFLHDGGVAIRDSKSPEQAALVYSVAEWRDFVAGIKNGEFDR